MTLSTSIIITSITLALLQYFEISSQNRVANARRMLRDEFVGVLKALDDMFIANSNQTATNIRKNHDDLAIFNVQSTGFLWIALFVVFASVVLIHAVHTFASLDDLTNQIQDSLAKVISYARLIVDVGLMAIVVIAGFHLYRKNRSVAGYERKVDEAIKTAKTAISLARDAANRDKT